MDPIFVFTYTFIKFICKFTIKSCNQITRLFLKTSNSSLSFSLPSQLSLIVLLFVSIPCTQLRADTITNNELEEKEQYSDYVLIVASINFSDS